MVDDTAFLDAHFATGVGQYDAAWDKVEAEWYMASEGCRKVERGENGFVVESTTSDASLQFPNVANLPANAVVSLHVAAACEGRIEIRENSADGLLLGSCDVAKAFGANQYRDVACSLKNSTGKKNLSIVFKEPSIKLDQFTVCR
jgi:hypothetical protein